MSPDGHYNRKKFLLRNCIFYGYSDGFRKGDPNIWVRIPDTYSRTAEEGEEVGGLSHLGRKVVSGKLGNNIASPSPTPVA